MPITAVIGGQWGDEGKGKVVDLLCQDVDVVARYQGGANAGHTVKADGDTFILHQVPSGILHPDILCILGHGVVLDPVDLTEELATLSQHGIATDGRILISDAAHLVTPFHKAMDRATGHVIGTTQKGIGPAYTDKARRLGIRAVDMLDTSHLAKYVADRMAVGIQQGEINPQESSQLQQDVELFLDACRLLAPLLGDTFTTLHQAIAAGKSILVEGAQGTLLDLDLGSFPFVTSSHPTVGGIATGLGIPSQNIQRLVGVFKAYTTRVGEGPFPTELNDEAGRELQEGGAEVGATTGRERRCGWFDAVAAAYACQVNGFTEVALTKLDVLDKFDRLQVCTGYELDGVPVPGFSAAVHHLDRVTPVYTAFPGWHTSTSGLRSFDALPAAAGEYVRQLEALMQVPIAMVSVGADRSQILTR